MSLLICNLDHHYIAYAMQTIMRPMTALDYVVNSCEWCWCNQPL